MSFPGAVRKLVGTQAWLLLLLHAAGSTAGAAAVESPPEAATAERSTTLIPFPFLFYSDETQLGGGVSLEYVTRRAGAPVSARPASYGLLALYTERKQYSLGIGIDRSFREERWLGVASVAVLEYPGDFFGFGNATHADSSEVYTPRGLAFEVGLERRIVGRWSTGPKLRWYARDIVDRVPAGLLERAEATGAGDGAMLTFGWSLTWDGRSHTFYPRSGGWVRVDSAIADAGLGGDFSYTDHRIDLRHYRSLGSFVRGRPVLAVRTLLRHTAGSVPFDQMPTLGGGELLRGYFAGRFRENSLFASQAELRAGHWNRMGVVVFVGAGTVADGLGQFRLAALHAVYGLGLRWQLSKAEEIHVRADLGFDDEGGNGFYLSFLEAF